jgi:hypothetical protein
MNAQEVISELILNAARTAVPADAEQLMLLPDCGPRNKRLMPLLIGLVEAFKVTADAVADNALDEAHPIEAVLAEKLHKQCTSACYAIRAAAVAPKKP